MPSQEFKGRFDAVVKVWTPSLFIKDTNNKWVDFTDRCNCNGRMMLQEVANVSVVSSRSDGTGLTFSRAIKVTLSNHDGFFDGRFPEDLKTEDGSTASFDLSKLGKKNVLFNRPAQIRINMVFLDGSTEQGAIANFVCGSIRRTLLTEEVELSLNDLSLRLRSKDSAARIRDGLNWYIDEDVPFLIKKLLEPRFLDLTTGALPSTFIIPDKIEIESAGSINGDAGDNRVLSSFARQPKKLEDGTRLNKSLICRSMIFAVDQSLLSSSPSPSALPGGTEYTKLYMGLDDALYVFNPATEAVTLIDDSTLGSAFLIRRLYFSVHQRKIYGIAYGTPSFGSRTVTAKVFRYDGTSFSVISTISNYFPGDQCFRDGRQITSSITQVGDLAVDGAGENVPSPYAQFMKVNGGTYQHFFEKVAAFDTDTSSWDDGATPIDAESGFYYTVTVSTGGPANTIPIHFKFNLGQKGFSVFNERSTTDIYLWYCIYNSGDETNDVKRINLNTAVQQTMLDNMREGSLAHRVDPLCGCANPDNSAVYIGGVFWDDRSGATRYSNGIIWQVDPTGLTQIIWDSQLDSAANAYFTPLDMVMVPSSANIIIVGLRRNRLNQNDEYIIGEQPINSSSSRDMDIQVKRRELLCGLVASQLDDTLVYMYEVGTGKILTYNIGSTFLTELDDGFPAVDNEYGLSCSELTVDSYTRASGNIEILYGNSSPTPYIREAYSITPTGRYKLFKADIFYSVHIELAKFEGMSTWRVLEYFGELCNYRPGFTAEGGDFYFVANEAEATETLLITDDQDPKRLLDFIDDSGESEVYNIVQAIPKSVFLAPPEFELRLVKRPEVLEGASETVENKLYDGDIYIQQKDNKKRTVRLECVAGGLVSEGKVKFRYRSTDERFETTTALVYLLGSSTVRISSGIHDVRKGDTIIIRGPDSTDERTVKQDPIESEIELGDITLDSPFNNNYSLNSFVEIIKNLNQWSDSAGNLAVDGLFQNWTVDELDDWGETAAGMDASEDTTAGNYLFGKSTVKITITSITSGGIQQSLNASELEADTLYSASCYGRIHGGDGSNKRADSVALEVSGAGAIVASVSASSTSTSFFALTVVFQTTSSPSGNVLFELLCNSSDLPAQCWFDGFVIQEGVDARLDYIVPSNSQPFPIPRTNIELKLVPQNEETRFEVGDQLLIRCPGLDIKEEEFSKRTAIDLQSTSIYGDIPYPNEINNPFLNRPIARDIVVRKLNEHAFPKRLGKVVTPITPYIDFLGSTNKITRLLVRTMRLFKHSPQWQEAFKIRSISHDLRSGLTRFDVRAVNRE